MKEKQPKKQKRTSRERGEPLWPGVDCSGLWENTSIYVYDKNVTVKSDCWWKACWGWTLVRGWRLSRCSSMPWHEMRNKPWRWRRSRPRRQKRTSREKGKPTWPGVDCIGLWRITCIICRKKTSLFCTDHNYCNMFKWLPIGWINIFFYRILP